MEIDQENNKLFMPKFKKQGIKTIIHRKIKGRIISGTISKSKTNKFFISLSCESKEPFDQLEKNINAVGVDLGIKSFLVFSNGEEIENPKLLRTQSNKIKHEQRRFSKTLKGSNNRNKKRIVVAKKFEKVSNQRNDFLQKLSTRIIRENQTVVLEDLNVKGMMGNHKLAGAIGDCSWSSFVKQLQYKADWYGREIIFVNRFFPSSKTCFDCGWINKNLTLKDRSWTCDACGVAHQRDLNAAKNIKKQGLNLKNMSGLGIKSDNKQKLGEASGRKRSLRNEKPPLLKRK